MHVGIVGINHKLADLRLRERLAKACQRRFSPDRSTHGDQCFVLLSTCNRTEIYFWSEDLPATHTYLLAILRQEVDQEFDQKLYSYFGYDCFLHLCRVTAGLDSAIVAETEIQGQVKAAYENAVEYTSLPSEMHYLFQKALKIGKQVRTHLPTKPGLPDLEHAIAATGQHIFQERKNPKILFVGASGINQKVLAYLKSRQYSDMTLCNRTLASAEQIAHGQQIQVLEWEKMALWHTYDWIIFGTKAPDHLISSPLNDACIGRKLIIDLSVPRNVHPDIGKDPQITLLNIDQLNRSLSIRRQRLTESLLKAETRVEEATLQHIRLFKLKDHHKLRLAVS